MRHRMQQGRGCIAALDGSWPSSPAFCARLLLRWWSTCALHERAARVTAGTPRPGRKGLMGAHESGDHVFTSAQVHELSEHAASRPPHGPRRPHELRSLHGPRPRHGPRTKLPTAAPP